jgi:hypothetical protein
VYIYIPNLNSREPDPLGDLGEEEQGALCPPRQDRRAKLEALPFQLSSVDTIAAILRGGFAVEAIYEVSITTNTTQMNPHGSCFCLHSQSESMVIAE